MTLHHHLVRRAELRISHNFFFRPTDGRCLKLNRSMCCWWRVGGLKSLESFGVRDRWGPLYAKSGNYRQKALEINPESQ
jgi:hypothetical protein